MKKTIALLPWLLMAFLILSGCAQNMGAQDARNGTVMIIAANDYEVSTGSGFFVGKPDSAAEYIVTNAHVISRMDGVAAVIDENDLGKYALDLVAIDEHKDIAILRSSKPIKERQNLTLSLDDNIDAADTVFAIGYPGASYIATGSISGDPTDATVTKGIISKTVDVFDVQYYQIDASISSGNSGGPLVTEQGNVIGINTLSAALDTNMNFAIKVEELIPLLDSCGIPYVRKSDFNPTAIIIICTVFVLAGVGIGLFFWIRKKRAAPPFQKTEPLRHYLFGSGGHFSDAQFDLYGKTLVLGRDMSRCNLVFPEDAKGISGVHCQLTSVDDKLYITDLGSRNGTYLSTGERLVPQRPYILSIGDSFYLAEPLNSFEWRPK